MQVSIVLTWTGLKQTNKKSRNEKPIKETKEGLEYVI